MSNKRLIDGTKLDDYISSIIELYDGDLVLEVVRKEMKSGRFDISSNQGEAARLREALFQANRLIDKIYNFALDQTANSLAVKCIASIQSYREALSSHTEDKKEFGYTCPNCEEFIKAADAHNAGMRCPTCKVREIVPITMIVKAEDTGIQKVQRLFEEHYNQIFATGERNHHECDICNAIEKTARFLGYKIDYRFDQISQNCITIPGITDGGETE